MYSIVIVIRNWTDPATGTAYTPGQVIAVEADRVARPDTYDSENAFRHPAPWERAEVGGTAPVSQPPNPFETQANAQSGAPAEAALTRGARAKPDAVTTNTDPAPLAP